MVNGRELRIDFVHQPDGTPLQGRFALSPDGQEINGSFTDERAGSTNAISFHR